MATYQALCIVGQQQVSLYAWHRLVVPTRSYAINDGVATPNDFFLISSQIWAEQ